MKITDLLKESAIDLCVTAVDKEQLIKKAVSLMVKQGNIKDGEQYLQAVMKREQEGSTGVGNYIAIPHGRCEAVLNPGLVAMVIPEGVEYESLDDRPVKLLFLIAAGTNGGLTHMDILSKLSRMLMNKEFTEKLIKAKSAQEFLQIIDAAEIEKDAEQRRKERSEAKRVLAVTGCPTGIAHTFMAAEALTKSAKEHGCLMKVETRGSGGPQNVLSEEEIRLADCIIVAADTVIPMDRFDGKKLIEVPVADGIGKADILIEKALSGNAAVYRKDRDMEETSIEEGSIKEKGGRGHRIYKHIMSGVSYMLPFVVGGGILIAIAFLIDSIMLTEEKLQEAGAAFGSITPIAATFKEIGSAAFGFMLPALAGFIAMSIADRPGLAVGFVGGFIASNGKSGFLGAIAAGFIGGYIVKALMRLFKGLPKSLDGIKPVLLFPVFGILLIGLIMTGIVEPAVGGINTALNDMLKNLSSVSGALLGFILGGMMAVDMGGPFNKAAYLFGTAAIAAGNYAIMAAVMIGGMVPPCAIALSTLLFKEKYTFEERKSGPTNFIMGLSFITEGAIPFAAVDPIRVIPTCIIGSGIAGALAMIFDCTLMAPHGGVFVFPVVGNVVPYIFSLIIGTVVTAVLLGLVKKRVG